MQCRRLRFDLVTERLEWRRKQEGRQVREGLSTLDARPRLSPVLQCDPNMGGCIVEAAIKERFALCSGESKIKRSYSIRDPNWHVERVGEGATINGISGLEGAWRQRLGANPAVATANSGIAGAVAALNAADLAGIDLAARAA